jgi:hypothetical protein
MEGLNKNKQPKKSEEYQKYIQGFSEQKTLVDKLIFLAKNYIEGDTGIMPFSDLKKDHYDKKLTADFVDEIKNQISTSKELDDFLSSLNSTFEETLASKGIRPERYDNEKGHGFIKAISFVIEKTFLDPKEHSYDDLDWWYTLGRHFCYSSMVMNRITSMVYKKENINNPKSIEFKKFLEQKGFTLRLRDSGNSYALDYIE